MSDTYVGGAVGSGSSMDAQRDRAPNAPGLDTLLGRTSEFTHEFGALAERVRMIADKLEGPRPTPVQDQPQKIEPPHTRNILAAVGDLNQDFAQCVRDLAEQIARLEDIV